MSCVDSRHAAWNYVFVHWRDLLCLSVCVRDAVGLPHFKHTLCFEKGARSGNAALQSLLKKKTQEVFLQAGFTPAS